MTEQLLNYVPKKESNTVVETEMEQRLETIFFSILDALRGVWHANNAANVLLSLIFYKRIVSLVEEKAIPYINIQQKNLDLLYSVRHKIITDPKAAVQALSYALIDISKNNPVLQNTFIPLVTALEQEDNLQHIAQIILILDEFDFALEHFSVPTFGRFFNNSLYKVSARAGKLGGERTTPKSINQLLVALAAPQNGEVIYDPTVGQGGSLIEFFHQRPNLEFIGQESNRSTYALCKMNVILNGIQAINIKHEDALLNDSCAGEVADVAIANFPFGLQLDAQIMKGKPYMFIPFDSTSTTELAGNSLFIQLMLHRLKSDGRMFVILPQKSLFRNGQERNLRERLIRNDWLEAVITLPYGLLYSTGSPICILAINKKKKADRQQRILFINGANLKVSSTSKISRVLSGKDIEILAAAFHGAPITATPELRDNIEWVDLAPIIENAYNLNAKHYASPFLKALKRLEKDKGLVRLHEIFEPETPSLWFDSDHLPHKNLPYLQMQHLGKSFGDYKVNLNNLDETNNFPFVEGRLVSESALLVNKKGEKICLSYFHYEGIPIVVHKNILSFKVDIQTIEIEYLILQLYSDLFLQQLNMYKSDHENPEITEREFGQLQIALPNLAIQRKEIQETKVELLRKEEQKVEALRHRLNLGKQKAQNEQYQIISSWQHELGNRLPAVLTEFKNLRDFLYDKIEDEECIREDEPIFPVMEGEDEEHVDKLHTVLERIENILGYSISMIDAAGSIIKADKSRLELSHINLKDLLLELKSNYANEKNFLIQIEVEEDDNGHELPIHTYADRSQLITAFSNLIENAKRHGFTEDRRFLIRFRLGLSSDGKDIVIEYKNDGRPFPSSFSFKDFIGYGNYAGETGHSGVGGFLIYQILDNHNGAIDYREDIDKNDPFKVQFEITLPRLTRPKRPF
ncbi:MAG: N-6 DNA methylase [Saprospiraceae bacterium]|nr:N-6 DNA methylase [Saprospiraceae bacterium]